MMNETDLARRALTTLKVIPPTPDEVTEQERRMMYEILLSFRQDMGSYVKVWQKDQVPSFEYSLRNIGGESHKAFVRDQLAFYYHDINAYHLTDNLTLANALELFQQLCTLADEADEKVTHSLLGIFLTFATNRIVFREIEQKKSAKQG